MAKREEPSMVAETKQKVEFTGKKVRIGMVGAGNISRLHAKSYAEVPAAEIVAVCDIEPDRLTDAKEAFGTDRTYTSIEEMVANEELDAIDVCVWNVNHAKCAIYGLEHGLNVLCEKPMAINAKEAEAMQKAAEKSGKLLMIGFVLRFSQQTQMIKEYMDRVGDVYYAKANYMRRHGAPGGWFCNKTLAGGGCIIDLGVHVIDQLRYLMGNPKPISVYATASSRIGFRDDLKNKVTWHPKPNRYVEDTQDVEDFGSAMIRYDNGAVVLLETSYSLNGEVNNENALYGTKGGITFGSHDPIIYTTDNGYLTDIHPLTDRVPSPDMFVQELTHFVQCVATGERCLATPEDGIWVMKVLDAVYESAKTGHEVVIK